MNDQEEIKYTLKLCIKWLEDQRLVNMVPNFESILKKYFKFKAYIFSCSENKTSQALQNYGEYALYFKYKDIQDMLVNESIPQQKRKKKCGFDDLKAYNFPLKVIYDKKLQMEYVSSAMSAWVSSFKCISQDPFDMEEIMLSCIKAIFLFLLCFKNPLLYQEEVRFISLSFNKQKDLKIKYNNNGKTYVSFPLKANILKSIILSKKAKLTSSYINKLLKSNKFDNTRIEMTELPY